MRKWRRELIVVEGKRKGLPAPGPPPSLFVGNTPALAGAYYRTLYAHIEEPVSVFYVHSTPFVVVNEVSAVKTVLSGSGGAFIKPRYFGYRSTAVRAAVDADNALSSAMADDGTPVGGGGDTSRRSLLRLIDGAMPDITAALAELFASWPTRPPPSGADAVAAAAPAYRDGEDAQAAVLSTIVALNMRLLFGVGPGTPTANAVASTAARRISFAGAEFARRMVDPKRVWVAPLAGARYVAAVVGLVRLGRSLVAAVERLPADHWVAAWVGTVRPVAKLGKVIGLLMASSQTVPLTIVWLLHLLDTHPAVRARLAAEADAVLGAGAARRSPTAADLDRLPYTEAVVKETLRLYPPFPLIQRVATDEAVLGGVAIPAGTPVFVLPYLLHRNAAHFSAPHTYDPDRWLGAGRRVAGGAPSEWAYAPFGRGPRACAGAALALAELKIAAVTAVTAGRFEVEWAGGRPPGVFPPLGVVPAGARVFRAAGGGV
ncbi:hypothetical protein BU14_0251s0005 [Porphyra umbilicalis]|nr:hypothetical protein BU14_0251s0005 [Porphyra umbilicalis]|eukprot:OSX75165.1 hypothetical protein BU14_0251s0005 [Porphyra umbilicalis]